MILMSGTLLEQAHHSYVRNEACVVGFKATAGTYCLLPLQFQTLLALNYHFC